MAAEVTGGCLEVLRRIKVDKGVFLAMIIFTRTVKKKTLGGDEILI